MSGKRKRRPSKRARQALGLPSDTEPDDNASDHSSNEESSPPEVTSAQPPSASTPSAPQPSVSATSSSASIVPIDKRGKFDLRYKTASRSDEEVLAAQMQSWTSDVYQHYVIPPKILRDNDTVRYIFVCKMHPSITVSRVRHDESTSNLVRHEDRCTPADTKEARAMAVFAQGSTYTPEKHRMKIAIWVSRRHRPFAIVEDEELLDIFHDLNPRVVTPSRSTVSRDVKEIYILTRKQVIERLKAYPGKVHICVDGWTSPQVFSFLGVTVHWIHDSRMVAIILEFVKATGSHTGKFMAARIGELLHTYELQNKLLGFVCDNASNNDTLVEALEPLVPSFGGAEYRVRCFAHILNLVVKAVLSLFAKKRSGEDGDKDDAEIASFEDGLVGDEEPYHALDGDDDGDEIEPSVLESDEAIIQEVARDAEGELRGPTLTTEDVKLGQFTLFKLRTLANKIVHSPTIRSDLAEGCRTSKIESTLMVRDVSTRWNSTSALVKTALKLKPALNLLVVHKDHNKPRGVRLQRFQLVEKEWKLLTQLEPLLDVFLTATKLISTNKIPLIHQVIPIIDRVNTALEKFVEDTTLLPAVRAAALRGTLMMNKYYSKTDESVIYRIAMIMHPRYKTSYFIRAGWPQEWIDLAISLVREEWKKYKPSAPPPLARDTSNASLSSRLFDDLDDDIALAATDALDDWLNSAPITSVVDPIKYWGALGDTPLGRMALDFLSVPASSTEVERAFSRGGLTVSKMRHSLSEESTRAATVLGSWAASPLNLIPHKEILEVISEKSKRVGKGKATLVRDSNAIVVDD